MDRLLEATARAERHHFWFHGFRRFVEPILAGIRDSRASLSILDCGCGTGHNLGMLRRYGTAVGIDVTFSGLAYARRYGERLVARASATKSSRRCSGAPVRSSPRPHPAGFAPRCVPEVVWYTAVASGEVAQMARARVS